MTKTNIINQLSKFEYQALVLEFEDKLKLKITTMVTKYFAQQVYTALSLCKNPFRLEMLIMLS